MLKRITTILSMAAVSITLAAIGNNSTIRLKRLLASPQDTCRTKVWWFHGETVTTKEGISADLEAFKNAGIGGVVFYDQVHGNGKEALNALSPEWWHALKDAAAECNRLGLTFESHLSDGYVGGGPWITPEISMKRLVTTQAVISAGTVADIALPCPESRYGFKDVAVLAVPIRNDSYSDSFILRPKASSSDTSIVADSMITLRKQFVKIQPNNPGKAVYLTLGFKDSFTARNITYQLKGRGKSATVAMNMPALPSATFTGDGYTPLPYIGELEVSADGIKYEKVCPLVPNYTANSSGWHQRTVAFPATSGKFFRLRLHDWFLPTDKDKSLYIGGICLSSAAKVNMWEEKSANYSAYVTESDTPDYSTQEVIGRDEIRDITKFLSDDGRLKWNAPHGRKWLILRFCSVPTGAKTKHSHKNMAGLECDKMSRKAVEIQYDNFFAKIADTLKAAGIPLKGLAMDSHEAGPQNWTDGMMEEFKRRKGYDMTSYLPAMAGYVVESVKDTEGFLYDYRRTLADMISDNYYGTLDSLCRRDGYEFTAQATGNAQVIVSDNLQAKGHVSKPQGEFWAKHVNGSYDIKEAASAAHVYGRRIASAEAFTDAKYSQSPDYLKRLADLAYSFGVNEFVVCASAYQPWTDKIPGNTAGGRQYCLNRNNTYWRLMRPFWDYQARSAAMMRQGKAVADLCIYAGDDTPMKILAYNIPEIPEGYDYDVCTTEGLTKRMTGHDGKITLPDGMTYSMLVINKNSKIPYKALRKIAQMVNAGVSLYGNKPNGSPSLADKEHQEEYSRLVDSIWSVGKYGKGNVYAEVSLSEALIREGIRPDLGFRSENKPSDKLYFAHRQTDEEDIYFIYNHSPKEYVSNVILRTGKRYAGLWSPVTGKQSFIHYASVDNGISINLQLRPHESCFIIASDDKHVSMKEHDHTATDTMTVTGKWTIEFSPLLGGCGTITTDTLFDWKQNNDPRIRYYSGEAIYRKTLTMKESDLKRHNIISATVLNGIAEVWINGKRAGSMWCEPYSLDISHLLKRGKNDLKIVVANSLYNRMIGDSTLPPTQRYTFATTQLVSPQTPLISSGIKAVKIISSRSEPHRQSQSRYTNPLCLYLR